MRKKEVDPAAAEKPARKPRLKLDEGLSVKKTMDLKLEQFAHALIASGMNATEAALKVGCEKANATKKGHEYSSRPEVKALVSKLQKELVEKFDISKQDLLFEIEQIKKDSLKMKDFKSALKAIELQAKMAGLFEPIKHNHNIEALKGFKIVCS